MAGELELRDTRQFGKALFAGRRFGSGETVLLEHPIFAVVDVESALRPALQGAGDSAARCAHGGGAHPKPARRCRLPPLSISAQGRPPCNAGAGGEEDEDALGLEEEDLATLQAMISISDRHGAERGTVNLLYSFLWCSSAATQSQIMDLFRPHHRVMAPALQACYAACAEICKLPSFQQRGGVWSDDRRLVDFLVIFDINCHGDELFDYSTRLAHSCAPNTFCRTEEDGALCYVALRQIEPGELLTFSYVGSGNMMVMPARLRQGRLARLGFLCCCDRCQDKDTMRLHRCPNCLEPTCLPHLVWEDREDEGGEETSADGAEEEESARNGGQSGREGGSFSGGAGEVSHNGLWVNAAAAAGGREGGAAAEDDQKKRRRRVVWRCGACGSEADARQLPLAIEAELEDAVLRTCCTLSEVEFRSECPPPVLWKLAKDCQEHLSENHWTRTAVLAALMRSVADALLVRDLSRTTQQMNLKHPNPTAPRQTREPGEGGQDEDEQDLPPPQQIVNVVQAVVSWYSDFHSGTLEEAKLAPLAAQIIGGFGMDRKAAEILAASYRRLLLLRHTGIQAVQRCIARYPHTAAFAGLDPNGPPVKDLKEAAKAE